MTAAHVVRGMEQARKEHEKIACQLGSEMVFDAMGKNAIIAINDDIDIATFRISQGEIGGIGKTVLTGYQKAWPPSPPQVDRGIYHSGFAGISTKWLSPREHIIWDCGRRRRRIERERDGRLDLDRARILDRRDGIGTARRRTLILGGSVGRRC